MRSIQQQKFTLFDSYYMKINKKKTADSQTETDYHYILHDITSYRKRAHKKYKEKEKNGEKRESILAENSIEIGVKNWVLFFSFNVFLRLLLYGIKESELRNITQVRYVYCTKKIGILLADLFVWRNKRVDFGEIFCSLRL